MKQTPSSQPSRFYTRNLNPMKTPMKKSVLNLFGALAFVALSTISVQAAGTDTWVGNTDANWNTGGNWTTSGGSTPPASGDSLVFGAAGSSGTSLNNNITSLSVNKLTFSSGASSFTFGGNTFTLGGGIDASALTSGTMTFPATTTIGNGFQRWNVGSGATLAFGRLGSGADAQDLYTPNGAVTIISGAGTVKTTTADGWGWRGGAVSGTGPLGPGMVIDNGNNTYDWASVGNQTSGTSRTIVAATYTTAPGSSDSHNVKVTANTTVTENNSWASLLVTGSTLTVNLGTALYLDTGMILENGGTVAGSAPVRSDNTDGLYIYVPDTGTISSVIQDNGGAKKLYKAGLGTLTLSGANSYSSDTVIYEGTIAAAGGGIAGTASAHISSDLGDIGSGQSRSIIINNGGNLRFTAGNVFGYDTATLSTVTLVVNQGGVFQTGPTSGSGYFSKIGPVNLNGGTISVGNGDNGYHGALALLGTVTVGGSTPSTIGILSGASTYDVVNIGQSNPGISSGTFNVADVTGDSGVDLTVSAGLANQANAGAASSITKTGAGTMALTGANTYSGTTTINAGTLLVNNTSGSGTGSGSVGVNNANTTLGGSGTISGAVTMNAGTILSPGTNSTTGLTLTCNGGVTFSGGAKAAFDLSTSASGANDKVAVTGTLTIGSADTITINPITASTLDTADYTLFTATSVAGSGTPTLVWGTSTPANPGYYSIVKNATTVVLHYVVPGAPPTVGPVVFSPVSPVYTGTVVTASATVSSAGTGLTYQWQGSSDDSTWANAAGSSTSATYLPSTSASGTNYYRLIATDSYGATTNAGAGLTVIIAPTVNTAGAVPSSLGHYQTTTITVNVTPASGQSITSVTVGVDGLGGAGDPVTLTSPGGNGAGNWTGTFTVPGTLALGSYTISGVVNQNNTGTAAWSVTGITVTNANDVWNGLGSDNKWSTGGNWVSGVHLGAGDSAVMAGTTQVTNNLDSSLSIGSLTFNSNAGSFDITNAANTLTLTAGVTNNSINAQTLDVPVALSAVQNINVAAGNIAINRAVSDSGAGLTLVGTKTLTLSGTNTYTGATVVNGGTLQMNSFNSSSASVTVNTGGTLALNFADALGFTTGKNVPTINSGGTITNSMSTNRVTLWNGLTMTGGTLTGAATVSDGNGEYSLSGTVTATSDASGTAATISGTPISLQNQNVANGSITFNVTRGSATPASDLNVSANLVPNSNAANVGLAKSGSGTLTLSATTNQFTGQLQVTGGTLNWNTAAALAPTSTYQPLSVQSGGTLVVNGYLRYSSGGSGNVYAYLNVGNNAAGGIGTITVNSAGSLSFTNMTSDPGSIIGQQGTGGISTLTVNGGAFNWDGSSSLAIGNGNGSGLLLITNNGTVTILAGASADDKYVALGRNSLTSTGTVYLASGTLASSDVFACGTATPIGKAYFNFDGGTLKALANQTDWLQSATVGNNNPLTAVTIKAGGAVIDANGFNVAINNAIASGAVFDGGLTLTNSSGSTGTLTLGGICAYNGSTTVNGGILKVTGTVPTATTVNPGGAIGPSTGTFSALVTLASGNSAINLLDNAITTTAFQNGLTLNNGNQLSFDLNSSTADQISVSGGSFLHSGTVTINLNAITSFTSGTTYTLITDAANDITTTSGFVVGTTPSGYAGVLGNSGGALTVTITQNAPNVAYWKGGLDNNWNTVSGGNANWTTDAAGTVNTVVPPGAPSSVIFAATGAGNFSTVLGANFTINNLTLSTANNVTIAGAANSLTLAAGLTNASTALNNLISVSNLVLGAAETVENDSASPLAISSLISGSSGLNTAGAGVIILTSTNNNYSGGTTIGAGTLQVGDKVTSNGAITGPVTNNGELLIANPAAQTLASAISGTGVLGKTGAGVLDLPNANTYTGGTVVSNGTLQIENNSALGTASENMTTSPVTNNGIINLNIGVAGTYVGRWFFNPLVGNGTINVIGTSNVESRLDGNMSGFTGTILVPASVATSKVDIEGDAVWNSAATIIVSNGGTLFVESASTTNDWAGQAEQVAATIYVSGSGNSEGYGALRVDDAAVLTGNVILQGTTVYGGAYDHHGRSGISGVISDGGLGYGISCANTINGQAEEFWGANTYSGGTAWTNAAYTLVLGNGSALQNSTLNIGPGQLLFDSVVTSNAFLFGGLTGTANITLTNGTSAVALTVGNNNSSTVYNGNLSDAGMGASLTKIGTGSLTLGGVDSYSGLTTIAGGTLVLNTSQTNVTTGIAVNDGATLTVEVAGTHQLAPASYTLGSSAGPVTNGFAGLTSTTVAPVNAGSVTLNGQTIVNIIGGSFTGGQTYPLISSTGISGPGGFALGTLPRGLVANLVTNGGNTIALYVTGYVPSFDVWTGAVNTNWDINGTSNWLVSGVTNTYLEGDNTWFDDTAVSTNVFVTVPVSPNSLVVSNNTTTYTFAGSAIGGAASLTKLGTGLLVLNNTNTYLGNTVISNGTVQLGGINVMPGGSGKGDVTLNGTLDLNGKNETINGLSGSGTVDTVAGGTPTLTIGSSGSSSTFNGVIQNSAGTLTVTKNGAGTLTLGGSNTYSGGTTVSAGTLQVANSNALGTAAATVNNGAILDLNGQTISENMRLNSGATLINSSATAATVSGNITTASSSFTAIGGTGNITLATITNASSAQFDVTNLNTGTVDLAGTNDNAFLNIHVVNGTVLLDKQSAGSVHAASALFVEGGTAKLAGNGGDQLFDGNTLTINSGTLDMNGRNETVGNLVGAGGVILNNAASTTGTLTIGGFNATHGDFKGVIENGAGVVALTKTGTGDAYLEGVNTYTGSTLINGGILYLANSGSINNSTLISIAGGATLDVALVGSGTLPLSSGETLTGGGTVNGNVTSAAGATINPGGGVAVSTLTVSSATLGGLLLMDLDRTNTPSNCDQLAGSITYGGTLVATNIGQDLLQGDTFQLFPTAAIGFAQITLPATNSVGYVYTWSNGVAVDGSISVLAVNPPVLVSTNAYLTSLVFNPTLGFAPAFTTNGTLYYETNAYLSAPTVTVTNADATATNTLIVNGVSLGILTNETASVPLTLGVGSTNVVQVQVVSQDLSVTNLYEVDVTMQGPPLSTNNLLTYLAVNPPAGILSGFVSNTITYAVTNYLPNNPVTVTVTNADTTATNSLFFQGSYVTGLAATGATSGALTLSQGLTNVVQVQVVSQSGATNTYTVNVTLQPSQTVPHLTNSVSGSTLTLTWPADHQGYRLLEQTNNLAKGVSSNTNDWMTMPGSTAITTTNITMPKTNLNEYYRLIYP